MQKQNASWIDFYSVMKELGIDKIMLFQLVQYNKIPAYRLLSSTDYFEDVWVDPKPIQNWDVEANHKPSQLVFKKEEVQRYKTAQAVPTLNPDHIKKDRKPLPVQIHKEAVRNIAARIWMEHPGTTIADMAFNNEISKACCGKVYAEKTIRNWIKDLCPNRNPGRRPNK